MSKILYINGEYHKPCLFHLCTEMAIGRKDKKFCSDQCKNAFHNNIGEKVRKEAKGYDTKIKKANRILMRIFKENENGYFAVKEITLSNLNFPFDLPTCELKDDRCSNVLHSFGSYAFYSKNDLFIFYKVKP